MENAMRELRALVYPLKQVGDSIGELTERDWYALGWLCNRVLEQGTRQGDRNKRKADEKARARGRPADYDCNVIRPKYEDFIRLALGQPVICEPNGRPSKSQLSMCRRIIARLENAGMLKILRKADIEAGYMPTMRLLVYERLSELGGNADLYRPGKSGVSVDAGGIPDTGDFMEPWTQWEDG